MLETAKVFGFACSAPTTVSCGKLIHRGVFAAIFSLMACPFPSMCYTSTGKGPHGTVNTFQKFHMVKEEMMNKPIWALVALIAVSGMIASGCSKKEPAEKAEAPQAAPAAEAPAASPATADSGQALFKQHCAVCHPDGGNIINPKKPLHAAALASANITKPADIVKIMRNPGPGMTKFDEATVSGKDATAIAEYVLKTFK